MEGEVIGKQYFNPRSRKGSDESISLNGIVLDKFQSTLPQGERLNQCIGLPGLQLFQSTLPQGERLQL